MNKKKMSKGAKIALVTTGVGASILLALQLKSVQEKVQEVGGSAGSSLVEATDLSSYIPGLQDPIFSSIADSLKSSISDLRNALPSVDLSGLKLTPSFGIEESIDNLKDKLSGVSAEGIGKTVGKNAVDLLLVGPAKGVASGIDQAFQSAYNAGKEWGSQNIKSGSALDKVRTVLNTDITSSIKETVTNPVNIAKTVSSVVMPSVTPLVSVAKKIISWWK